MPPFDARGLLPVGVHPASWAEIEQHFGWNGHRRKLISGLEKALNALKRVGCPRVYVNGSFVTAKPEPGDIDVAWETQGVDVKQLLALAPALGDFSQRRAAQKAAYGCEFFPASVAADSLGTTFLDFFQIDKETGEQKGLIVLEL